MALEELQNGRYHRLRPLGSGGMGEVHLMQDERVSRQVAIKVIRSENTPTPDSDTSAANAARLFQREAKAIAALEHPNILPLYDFGEETSEGTTVSYMVMPYCAEGSLAGWYKQSNGQTLSPQDIAALIGQAAEALQYAHDHGVIHLDVKPSNFLLRGNKRNPNRPTLLLADFGIARSSSTVSNASRTIRGTPTSMAPEQWTSNPVAATDQYALAVMTYEMLALRPPFMGSMEQLMYQHFSVQPQPPSSFNASLLSSVDAVILRALAKKPEERFPSISAFADALEQAVHAIPVEHVSETDQPGIDSYNTLAITKAEAETGISRLITLPGGKQVVVPIPAGTRDGEVIRLAEFDETLDQSAVMMVNIAVKQTNDIPLTTVASNVEQPRETPQLLNVASVSNHDLPTIAAVSSRDGAEPITTPKPQKSVISRLGIVGIVSVLAVILVIGSALYVFSSLSSHKSQGNTNTATLSHTTTSLRPVNLTATAASLITPTPTPQNGLYIPGIYNGSMFDQTTQQTRNITIFLVQKKGDGTLSGSVTYHSSPQGVYPLKGVVDLQGNFTISFKLPTEQQPMLFYGTVKHNGGDFLQGNFCNSTTNTCQTQRGYFNVGPGY